SDVCSSDLVLTGSNKSVSRVPGAEPRTSTPQVAPFSITIAVHPVRASVSSIFPTLISATSVIFPTLITSWSFLKYIITLQHKYCYRFLCTLNCRMLRFRLECTFSSHYHLHIKSFHSMNFIQYKDGKQPDDPFLRFSSSAALFCTFQTPTGILFETDILMEGWQH